MMGCKNVRTGCTGTVVIDFDKWTIIMSSLQILQHPSASYLSVPCKY